MTNSYSRKMAGLLTEQRNLNTLEIDRKSVREILELIHQEDRSAVNAVGQALPEVEQAVNLVEQAFRKGGRLIYVGAGTSGRLGVLDAAECPPTFGSPLEMVQGIIAGGYTALHRAIEGAEDHAEDGAVAIREKQVGPRDVVMGIASSSVTPFVLGALQEARQKGAPTIFLSCTPIPQENRPADVVIELLVGPEVVTGSTRMKAGTATKLVLNMITTTSMIRIGKVYQNLMVDLTATCNKLRDRAHRILTMLTDLSYDQAGDLLIQADMRVKTALVMHLCKKNREDAERILEEADGMIHRVLEKAQNP